MKYYKNDNNEIFAFNDDFDTSKDITRLSLTLMTEQEVTEILTPKIDEKEQELISLNSEITELEELIKKALIIGNNAVLESLRAELKELIVQREELRK